MSKSVIITIFYKRKEHGFLKSKEPYSKDSTNKMILKREINYDIRNIDIEKLFAEYFDNWDEIISLEIIRKGG